MFKHEQSSMSKLNNSTAGPGQCGGGHDALPPQVRRQVRLGLRLPVLAVLAQLPALTLRLVLGGRLGGRGHRRGQEEPPGAGLGKIRQCRPQLLPGVSIN